MQTGLQGSICGVNPPSRCRLAEESLDLIEMPDAQLDALSEAPSGFSLPSAYTPCLHSLIILVS